MGSHFLATVGAHVLTGVLVCSIITLTKLPTSSAERERRQLPCNHLLRIARPGLFKHCNSVCKYTTWSSWWKVPNSIKSVPANKCPSGEAYTEERTRTVVGNGCTEPLREEQNICESYNKKIKDFNSHIMLTYKVYQLKRND